MSSTSPSEASPKGYGAEGLYQPRRPHHRADMGGVTGPQQDSAQPEWPSTKCDCGLAQVNNANTFWTSPSFRGSSPPGCPPAGTSGRRADGLPRSPEASLRRNPVSGLAPWSRTGGLSAGLPSPSASRGDPGTCLTRQRWPSVPPSVSDPRPQSSHECCHCYAHGTKIRA